MSEISPSRRRQLFADLSLLFVAMVWGGTFVTVKSAVANYPVFAFLAIRFGLAAMGLLVLGWRRLRTLGWRGVGVGILIGTFLFGGYAFQTVGLRYTTASKAGFITGLSVALVPILSTLLLRRRPSLWATFGVCLATVGLALLALDPGFTFAKGDLIVLGCAFCFALHIVGVSAFSPRCDPLALTMIQVAWVAVVSLGTGLLWEPDWSMPASSVWLVAGFTGVVATALAFFIQTSAQRFTTPTHTALIFSAEPVFAALFGVFLASEVMTGRHIAGGALIVMGAVVSEFRWLTRRKSLRDMSMG